MSDIAEAVRLNSRIVLICMLRDVRTRFGRTNLSYLLAIAWPLSHLFVIIISFTVLNKIAPIGNDPTVFAMSGLLPYIVVLYPATRDGNERDAKSPASEFHDCEAHSPDVRPMSA